MLSCLQTWVTVCMWTIATSQRIMREPTKVSMMVLAQEFRDFNVDTYSMADKSQLKTSYYTISLDKEYREATVAADDADILLRARIRRIE